MDVRITRCHPYHLPRLPIRPSVVIIMTIVARRQTFSLIFDPEL
jgi:hypothetical protein